MAAEKEAPAPEVSGVQLSDFLAWRRSPVTKMFLEYLRDYRGDLRTAALELWESGNLESKQAEELRGRSLALGDINDLTFEGIWTFYQQMNAANQRDGETNAQESREQL